MKEKEFKGVYAVTVTPFKRDTVEVDYSALEKLIEYLIAQGVHGLVANGSTGEFASLEDEERKQVAEEYVQIVNGRVPVIVGASDNSTARTVLFSQQAEEIGADGLMIVHPYYCMPGEEELYHHYKAVAAATSLPIMIYNNPWTSGVDASPQLLARMTDFPNVKYIKEASAKVQRVHEIIRESQGKLSVFCGWDDIAFESFLLGASGWVAGSANLMPRENVELYDLIAQGEIKKAKSLYYQILPLLSLLENGGKFVQYIKAGLNYIGIEAGIPRAPLLEINAQDQKTLQDCMEKCKSS